uniref:F-box domain-containing protein n=1 Tax=Strigamia maritima TaxID=126957 RepID=T1J786_STRMM
MEKGILGLKTDPKNKVLYFVNGGNWPSDDSGDATYIPGLETSPENAAVPLQTQEMITKANEKKRKKRKPKDDKSPKKQKTTHCTTFNLPDEVSDAPSYWGTASPPEILIKIFKLVIRTDGVLFLQRAAKVCTLWERATYDSSLWETVDMSLSKVKNEEKFIWLCKNRLSHVKELNLSKWGVPVTPRGIKAVIENCPHLTNINLSGCKKLSAADVKLLADNCVHLSKIDLSHIAHYSRAVNPVSHLSLKYLMSKLGKNIVYFSMANNTVTGVPMIFNCISEQCPRLQALDFSNVQTTNRDVITLNIEKLQEGCPNLQILRLANTSIRLANVPLHLQVSTRGFPKLKELSIAGKGDGFISTIEDSGLDRILKSSEELQLLDVRGCKRITTSSLIRIPAWNLQSLFLSQCPAAMDAQLELVMQKWKHSLIEVDLSWNNHINQAIDLAITALTVDPETSKLVFMDLCGSSVTFESVKKVLSKCLLLRKLNLTSCRGLPRGMKRAYADEELDQLREDIESEKFVQYDEIT